MGTWGHRNFENDDAYDFVYDVQEEGENRLFAAIKTIVSAPPEEYLEATECAEALAAIEFLAASKGKPASDLPDEAKEWLVDNHHDEFLNKTITNDQSGDIISSSKKAIERIEKRSELKELWKESEDFQHWIDVLHDLKSRLG